MDNKDEILRLLAELPNVIEHGVKPLPNDVVLLMPEGSVTFYVREFKPGAGINGTDRDNIAEIYLPPFVFQDANNNSGILDQIKIVLAEIDVNGTPTPTFTSKRINQTVQSDQNAE